MGIQYAGGTNVHTTFSGVVKNDILSNTLSNLISAGWTQISGITPSVVTMTIASPGVITLNSHGLSDGTRIVFSTSGALPTGITAGTVYFVKSPSTNTFNVAATSGGTAINTTGSQSGVHTMNSEIVMQTATTPQGYKINCRFRDNGATCVTFSIETSDGVIIGNNSTTQGGFIRPGASKTWHIAASKYQFFLWVDSDFNVGNEFLCVSCPYVFSFLAGSNLPYIGILQSGGRGDGTGCATCSGNWRYTLYNSAVDNSQNWYQAIYGNNIVDSVGSPGSGRTGGTLTLQAQNFDANVNAAGSPLVYRYGNNDLSSIDTVLAWGLTSISDEAQVRCQLWDSIIVTDQFLGDTTTSFDSHNWIALTSSQTSATNSTLFIVTS